MSNNGKTHAVMLFILAHPRLGQRLINHAPGVRWRRSNSACAEEGPSLSELSSNRGM